MWAVRLARRAGAVAPLAGAARAAVGTLALLPVVAPLLAARAGTPPRIGLDP